MMPVPSRRYRQPPFPSPPQVSLWRNWAQTGPVDVSAFTYGPIASDAGLAVLAPAPAKAPAAVPAEVSPFDDKG